MRRIVIIGTSCSGKTTLAREVSRRLGLSYIELDTLYWGPNWTPKSDFAERVEEAIGGEGWVVDGNYTAVRHLTWQSADTIVWLDYQMRVVLMRGLFRSLARSWKKTELWSGNRESLRLQLLDKDSILLWIINTWRLRRRNNLELLRSPEYAGKRIVRLRTPGETRRWVDRLNSRAHLASKLADYT